MPHAIGPARGGARSPDPGSRILRGMRSCPMSVAKLSGVETSLRGARAGITPASDRRDPGDRQRLAAARGDARESGAPGDRLRQQGQRSTLAHARPLHGATDGPRRGRAARPFEARSGGRPWRVDGRSDRPTSSTGSDMKLRSKRFSATTRRAVSSGSARRRWSSPVTRTRSSRAKETPRRAGRFNPTSRISGEHIWNLERGNFGTRRARRTNRRAGLMAL
jgi:hypothetical protein